MKVINSTAYETADLRRFAQKTFVTLHVSPAQRKRYVVEFHYWRKGSHCRGRASYNRLWLECYLPRNPGELNLVQMASTFRHERAHNLDVRHREMGEDLRYCWSQITRLGDFDWSWLWGFQIRLKQHKRRRVQPVLKEAAGREVQ